MDDNSNLDQRVFRTSTHKPEYLNKNLGWLDNKDTRNEILNNEYFKKIIRPRIHPNIKEEVTKQTVDHALAILGRCNNPDNWEKTNEITKWKVNNSKQYYYNKQGLVYGMVQSGKTASMVTLMGLAKSAGYNFLILLSSDKESLRFQTQKRLNQSFNISPSGSFEHSHSVIPNDDNTYEDLFLNDKVKIQSFTKEDSDYSTDASELIRKFRSGFTLVVCVKKNKAVLEKFLNDLTTFNENYPDDFQKIKALIVDDEADYGSQNTKKKDISKINELITNIRIIINKNCFVQYTATPQACIGADPSKLVGYPKDFIWLLKVFPEGGGNTDTYLGANEFFDKNSDDLIEELDNKTWPHYVKDHNGKKLGVMNWNGKLVEDEKGKVDPKASLPKIEEEALNKFLNDKEIRNSSCIDYKRAITDFLITCALRWYRDHKKSENTSVPLKDDIIREKIYDFHAMIFNLAFKTVNHVNLQKLIKILFNETKSEFFNIEFNNLDNNSFYKQYLDQKNKTFKLKNKEIPEFKDLHPFIKLAIDISGENIRGADNQFIYILNSKDEGSTLNYDSEIPGERTKKAAIIIGGHILGRGLTVKNLCTSFFIRSQVKSLGDTNLQMCRWFGHKRSDMDLISVYITKESINLFKDITHADNYLRAKFEESIDKKQPAKCFMLDLHSNNLFNLTAPNKGRYFKKVRKSFSGKELLRYPRSHPDFQENNEILKNFLDGKKYEIMHQRAQVYRDINIQEFVSFFQKLKISDTSELNQTPKKYIKFLKQYEERKIPIPKLNIALWNYDKIGEGKNDGIRYETFETPYRKLKEYTFLGHQWVDKSVNFHKDNEGKYKNSSERKAEHGILINFNRVNQNYIDPDHKKKNIELVEAGMKLPPVIYYVIHTPEGAPSFQVYQNSEDFSKIKKDCKDWKAKQNIT